MEIWRLAPGAILLVALGGCGRGSTTTISLDRETIQSAVAGFFPLSSDKPGDGEKKPIRVTLSDPEVLLEDGAERMGLRMKIAVEASEEKGLLPDGPPIGKPPGPPLPGRSVFEGTLVVHGEISYKPEEVSFYYQNPTVTQLTFPQLPPPLEIPVRNLAEAAMAKYLQVHPIHTLSDANLKSRAAKTVLKSIAVKNGKLDIEIGW